MIDKSLYNFLVAELDPSLEISFGKVDPNFNWESGTTTVSFTKTLSQSGLYTPTYLDSFQLSVRNQRIDYAQDVANDIIKLFHLYSGVMGDYKIMVTDVYSNGVLYEEEDIVHVPVQLELKYTQI